MMDSPVLVIFSIALVGLVLGFTWMAVQMVRIVSEQEVARHRADVQADVAELVKSLLVRWAYLWPDPEIRRALVAIVEAHEAPDQPRRRVSDPPEHPLGMLVFPGIDRLLFR
jgi:hypothetical protein